MEGTTVAQAKLIFGANFIGHQEISAVADQLRFMPVFDLDSDLEALPWTIEDLQEKSNHFLLIRGAKRTTTGERITLKLLRDLYGVDPEVREPCFYNQDWYFKETFFHTTTLNNKWYLIRKELTLETRGQPPSELQELFAGSFPSAILTAYAFFAFYFHSKGQRLWDVDFSWCSDADHNGDMIYTGRYTDPSGVNKSGFNIHRHLGIRPCHGLATSYE